MEWKLSQGLVPYPDALAFMEERVAGIRAGEADEMVWLLEHPPLYTSGSSARESDLLAPSRFPVYHAGRGGEYTYHGPGQRIAYVMLDLRKLFAPAEPDLRAYIQRLEQWIIAALAALGVEGFTRQGRIGVWVNQRSDGRWQMTKESSLPSVICHLSSNPHEAKIAAIGVRVRGWVSFHGIALNVNPELEHFSGIVPCGIREYVVTSLAQLGVNAEMAEVDAALKNNFARIF